MVADPDGVEPEELLEGQEADHFSGEVKVASRIVDYLSSGLYESPAACLKELVNNSYDADAKKVEVFIKPEADQILVIDDGRGLTRDEFVDHFNRVSESHKRDDRGTTPSGRPMVGRIGIGLIAANELCDLMEINSTKKGHPERLRVTLDFAAMRADPAGDDRKEEAPDGTPVYKKGDYEGWVEEAPKSHHYTQIILKQIRPAARSMFAGIPRAAHTAGDKSLYGRTPEEVVKALENTDLRSWSEFDEYSQTMLEVGLNVPVKYAPKWIPSDVKARVADLASEMDEAEFELLYDGTDVRKPTVLRADEGHFLRRFNFTGESVSAKGYFFAKRRVLRPQELNGVLIRIRRAAVGGYDPSWLDFSATENRLFQDWVSAEIWADDRLEEALNIDRRTLRVTHPAYVELQAAIHEKLSEVLKEARDLFYTQRSKTRRRQEAKRQVEAVHQVASDYGVRLSEDSKRVDSDDAGALRRAVAMKSVSEVYELVLETAKDELPDAQFRRFAAALAERLLE